MNAFAFRRLGGIACSLSVLLFACSDSNTSTDGGSTAADASTTADTSSADAATTKDAAPYCSPAGETCLKDRCCAGLSCVTTDAGSGPTCK